MRYITLELAKKHLVVEHNEDDTYIEHCITAAERAVENYVSAPLESYMCCGFLPAALQHGILLVLGTLYSSRESVVYTSVSIMPAVQLLLQPYKAYR